MAQSNSFNTKSTLRIGKKTYTIFKLSGLKKKKIGNIDRLPFSLKILLENLLRAEDGVSVTENDIRSLASWNGKNQNGKEIAFTPARVILQDFTGVPAVCDLAAMRDAMSKMGGNPNKINPLQPGDLVIDHSVQVDHFGSSDAFDQNAAIEFIRNKERYQLLRWGQNALKGFSVVPPDTGIVHQVNLEYLARGVFGVKKGKELLAYPDTLVGTDSHTTMVNGLGILGWGVGGIEAEAAMLGQPITMTIPDVVGFKLKGKLSAGATATDLVLTVVEMLRKKGVVGKFVEFYGQGLSALSLADRATLANMAPEYGATMGFFPIDEETLRYLSLTGRDQETISLIRTYCKAQGLFDTKERKEPIFTDKLELEMSTVVPCISGPTRPQDRIALHHSKKAWHKAKFVLGAKGNPQVSVTSNKTTFQIEHGSVVIAAITSCTNTSNPSVMLAAGLVAKKAVERGLTSKPWVKTSLSPGSKVVSRYLNEAGLTPFLDALRFHLTGYGCMTCIGNSGPISEDIGEAIDKNNIVATSVLSGNRNFEGRINPRVKANYLASPPLVVIYALAGTIDIDLNNESVGTDPSGKPVFMKDLWPSDAEIQVALKALKPEMFTSEYKSAMKGSKAWQNLKTSKGDRFKWSRNSTYIKRPPFFDNMPKVPVPAKNIVNARVLAMLGDSVTTDHISPAGAIPKESPAGKYLMQLGIKPQDFNSFGSRRGNHEVMVRGTFGNIRLRNLLVPGTEGGVTLHVPSKKEMSIFEASEKYTTEKVPLVILAGKEYGTGSSRDWAAKGTALLGVKAVITESFERIHRSNLIGMAVLPLQFEAGQNYNKFHKWCQGPMVLLLQ